MKSREDSTTPAEIVAFWREAGPERWFAPDDDFDGLVRSRFLALHEAAARGELAAFEDKAEGALALLILLDQFPRNMFRGTARAFATDALARAVADRAIARGFDAGDRRDAAAVFLSALDAFGSFGRPGPLRRALCGARR